MSGPALWSQQPNVVLQVWDSVVGKLCRGTECGSVGQHIVEHEPAVFPGSQGGHLYPDLYHK